LFVRNATGLVREVSPRAALLINYIPGCPVQVVAAGLFFAFALFPGGNFLLALVLAMPMSLAFAYAFGLLVAAIPRSGGDYVLVSRIIHPAVGFVSSFCMLLAAVLSLAFFGIVCATIALGPSLIIVGILTGNTTLVAWGTTCQTDKTWQLIIGSVALLGSGLLLIGGWKWTTRIFSTLFVFTMAGLVVCAVIALLTPTSTFIDRFNAFALPYTHVADTYHNVINAAATSGVNVNPGFSLEQTIPLVGVLAGFTIYSWWAVFIGGELRQASSLKTANRMALAGILNVVSIAIFVWIFLQCFGTSFLIATNSAAGALPASIGVAPYYFVMISAVIGNAPIAILLAASFVAYWPLVIANSYFLPTRILFALAFDGMAPKWVTAVTRAGTPWASILLSVAASIVVLAWGLGSSFFFTLLVFATLFQLISMGLVGLSAVVMPTRRPVQYRGSVTSKKIAGVPIVVIAGVASIVSCVILYIVYFSYPSLGLADKPTFFMSLVAWILVALAYYYGMRFVKRLQGIDVTKAYAEIPPE
jgi:amino acid transporter